MRSRSLFRALLVFAFAPGLASADDCAATKSNGRLYGNDALTVGLSPDGKFAFAPNGPGFIDHDGALGIKVGWERKIKGRLDITGRRIDGSAARARAYIPDGYDDIGFQPSYVVFPTPGCWEIVASMGEKSLSFVVAVEFVAPGPRSRLNGVPRGWRQTGG